MLESELSESAPLTCNECDRLWQEYENAVRAHAEIVDDYQRALIQRDSVTVARLESRLGSALERRAKARRAVVDHESAHPH
jgi:hypothetical protein